jgi:hypothetical protein
MPYKDPVKEKEYHQQYREQQKQKRNVENAAMGIHTRESSLWPRPLLTEAQAMWVSAVLDCEGCLTLGSYHNKSRGGYNFRCVAQVVMTREEVIEQMYKLCHGYLGKTPYRFKKRNNNKDQWIWKISSNGLRWLLPQIEPYLLIKKGQAILLIEFLTLCKRGIASRSSYNPRAQQIRAEMARLNYRGIPTGIGVCVEPLHALPSMPPDEAWT